MPELNEAVGGTVFHWKDLDEELLFKICVTPWSKFYKHDLIKKSGARFPIHIIYQDNIFFWEVLFNTEKIYFYNKFLYTRRTHSNSCVHSNDEKNIDSIKINNMIMETFMKYGYFEKYKARLYNRKINLGFKRYTEIRDEFKELYFSEMKKDFLKNIGHEKYDEFYSLLYPTNRHLLNNVMTSENHIEFDLRNKVSRLKMDIYDLSQEKSELAKKANALKKENKNLTKLNNDILSSRSWKVTKPLRSFRKML